MTNTFYPQHSTKQDSYLAKKSHWCFEKIFIFGNGSLNAVLY